MLKSTFSSFFRVFKRYDQFYCNWQPPPMFPSKWSILPNGVRIVTEESTSPLACIRMFIEAGPRYETACNNGITHFIEHMAYKGFISMRRCEFEEHIKALGARLNVETHREMQVFTATCPPECAPIIVNYFSRIICELDFCPAEIDIERCIIDQELEDAERDHKTTMFDYLHATAFQGTPLGQRVIGPQRNLEKFDRCFARLFLQEHYQPWRIVIAAAGTFCHDDIYSYVCNEFGCLVPTVTEEDLGPCRFTGSEVRFRDDSLPYGHICIAFEVAGYGSSDYLKLLLLSCMLGSYFKNQGTGERLVPYLAQASAGADICQHYEPFYIAYCDVGLFGVYFTSEALDQEDMLYLVQNSLLHACLTTQYPDLQRAANFLKLKLAKRCDGCINSSFDAGYQMLHKCYRSNMKEWYDALSNIKVENMRDVADKYFYDRCPAVAAVGPCEGLPEYNRIRAGMYWLRL